MTEQLNLADLLETVELVDAAIDAHAAPDYAAQPLAADWARVTKVCEEAGEVWQALSKWTGENPRKGVCGTLDDLLGELADCVSAAMCAIQHLTKDADRTWEVVSAAFIKARDRISTYLSLPAETQAAVESEGIFRPGSSLHPTPDCGAPHAPGAELWWCAEHKQFHEPVKDDAR